MATSAFKKAPLADTYIFEYQPPSSNDYSVASVENDSNWVYTATAPDCGGTEKACSLEVPENDVNTGTTPTLKSSVGIEAELNSQTGTAYVTEAAGGDATIDNQDD